MDGIGMPRRRRWRAATMLTADKPFTRVGTTNAAVDALGAS